MDGFDPAAGLVLSGHTLYGTAFYGGNNRFIADQSSGSVFALSTTAHPFVTLHSFRGDDLGEPQCNLVLSGNTLYGTGVSGGVNGSGSVFDLTTNENDGPSGINRNRLLIATVSMVFLAFRVQGPTSPEPVRWPV